MKQVRDCYDSGCLYTKVKTGMRTQGGKCRCLEHAVLAERAKILERLILACGGYQGEITLNADQIERIISDETV